MIHKSAQLRKEGIAMEETLAIAKALSDRSRLRILMLIWDRPLCVCHITDVLCSAPSTVSKHLSILKTAGLIDSYKRGRWVHYHMPDERSRAVALALEWVQDTVQESQIVSEDRERLKSCQR